MDTQTLHDLVERIAGKEHLTLIGPALECFQIQTEVPLTEKTASQATRRAIGYLGSGLLVASPQNHALSVQRQLIADHLQRA
ncbi:MAG: hypothetical protein ACJAWL_002997 [Motiliproteus sp.]|jgi:hypothetical protein